MLETLGEVKGAAVRLLARREHSRMELEQKIGPRVEPELLAQALDALEADGYLSDARFAAVYLRSKAALGFGPMRIRGDMGRKGIGAELWQQSLEEQGIDWFEQARDLAQRRFGTVTQEDRKHYAKCMRYLLGRGYNLDQARYALQQADDE
uniref:regulatory protein RecX n=1 Tax=Marinobacterium profundum TaxID=1714300 RepID=UPI00082D2FDA|nr:regulatory protein RecX [Marinobacterium profundum]